MPEKKYQLNIFSTGMTLEELGDTIIATGVDIAELIIYLDQMAADCQTTMRVVNELREATKDECGSFDDESGEE